MCADSYFASVVCDVELMKYGLRFIGLIKTSTSMYSMSNLQQTELQEIGDMRGHMMVKRSPDDIYMISFV